MLERFFSLKNHAVMIDLSVDASRAGTTGRGVAGVRSILTLVLLTVFMCAGCSNLTGWRIPGIEKSEGPTTTIYLVCENAETLPAGIRSYGKIYVDGAFFGLTSSPQYYKFVGNALVVGKIQTEKEREHTIRVAMPGYEPFEHTRYYGTLREYSISFRLKRLEEGDTGKTASGEAQAGQSTLE